MELRENAKKEVYKQELLHKRIKERTWDTMDVQLKAINGLRENYLVYNYNIRKRQPEELRRYFKIFFFFLFSTFLIFFFFFFFFLLN